MFIMILYMFRALYIHHQEVELYWCSTWYRHSQSSTCFEHYMLIIRRLNCI